MMCIDIHVDHPHHADAKGDEHDADDDDDDNCTSSIKHSLTHHADDNSFVFHSAL